MAENIHLCFKHKLPERDKVTGSYLAGNFKIGLALLQPSLNGGSVYLYKEGAAGPFHGGPVISVAQSNEPGRCYVEYKAVDVSNVRHPHGSHHQTIFIER